MTKLLGYAFALCFFTGYGGRDCKELERRAKRAEKKACALQGVVKTMIENPDQCD